MKVFVDIEFNIINAGNVPVFEVISLDLVDLKGASVTLICNEFDVREMWSKSLISDRGGEVAHGILNDVFDKLLALAKLGSKSKNLESTKLIDLSINHSEFTLYNLKYLLYNLGLSKQEVRDAIGKFAGKNSTYYSWYTDFDFMCFSWIWGDVELGYLKCPRNFIDIKKICNKDVKVRGAEELRLLYLELSKT